MSGTIFSFRINITVGTPGGVFPAAWRDDVFAVMKEYVTQCVSVKTCLLIVSAQQRSSRDTERWDVPGHSGSTRHRDGFVVSLRIFKGVCWTWQEKKWPKKYHICKSVPFFPTDRCYFYGTMMNTCHVELSKRETTTEWLFLYLQ